MNAFEDSALPALLQMCQHSLLAQAGTSVLCPRMQHGSMLASAQDIHHALVPIDSLHAPQLLSCLCQRQSPAGSATTSCDRQSDRKQAQPPTPALRLSTQTRCCCMYAELYWPMSDMSLQIIGKLASTSVLSLEPSMG